MKSKKTVERYGRSFQIFDQYADYQRSIAFSILQIGELSGAFRVYRTSTADRIQWGPMKGMRNMVAHHYGAMERQMIGKLS